MLARAPSFHARRRRSLLPPKSVQAATSATSLHHRTALHYTLSKPMQYRLFHRTALARLGPQARPKAVSMADDTIRAPTVTASSTHNLLTVPPEVCERIAQLADPPVLLNLRLTSKETAARILRTYGQTLFGHMSFMMCFLEDLNRLLSVSQSELATFMTTITLVVNSIPNPNGRLHLSRTELDTEQVKGISQRELQSLMESQNERLEEMYSIQEDNETSKLDLWTLNMAFCHLRQKNTRPAIQIADLLSVTKRPQYREIMLAETGVQPTLYTAEVYRHVQTVFEALVLSDLQTQHLATNLVEVGAPLSMMMRDDVSAARISPIFNHLHYLCLVIDADPGVKEGHLARLFKCLSAAPKMRELRLESLRPWRECPFRLFRQTFATLTSLYICSWKIQYSELVQFLKVQPKLEYLELESCTLRLDERHAHLAELDHEEVRYRIENTGAIVTVVMKECDVRNDDDW